MLVSFWDSSLLSTLRRLGKNAIGITVPLPFSSSTPTQTRNGNRRPEPKLSMRNLSPCLCSATVFAHIVPSLRVCVASETHRATTGAPGKEVSIYNAILDFRKPATPSSAFAQHQSSFHTQRIFANPTPQRVDSALSALFAYVRTIVRCSSAQYTS
jgi:hypothetical protein